MGSTETAMSLFTQWVKLHNSIEETNSCVLIVYPTGRWEISYIDHLVRHTIAVGNISELERWLTTEISKYENEEELSISDIWKLLNEKFPHLCLDMHFIKTSKGGKECIVLQVGESFPQFFDSIQSCKQWLKHGIVAQ